MAGKRDLAKWLLNELTKQRWTPGMFASALNALGVVWSEDEIIEVIDCTRDATLEFWQATEAIFGQLPQSLRPKAETRSMETRRPPGAPHTGMNNSPTVSREATNGCDRCGALMYGPRCSTCGLMDGAEG